MPKQVKIAGVLQQDDKPVIIIPEGEEGVVSEPEDAETTDLNNDDPS